MLLTILLSILSLTGRVVDTSGEGICYATVYMQNNPIVGSATNLQGYFSLEAEVQPTDSVVISYVGFERLMISAHDMAMSPEQVYVLREQPIALTEMVVSAKASKQKNKRKQMAQLLYKVYNRMLYDFPVNPVEYHIVSDVKMDSQDTPWGMEQMIARVVELPDSRVDGHDSVQFAAEYCKRFFQQSIRNRADTILADNSLSKKVRQPAVEMDSGVVVHKGLWAFINPKFYMRETMEDVKKWSVSKENEQLTVLTYTLSKNFLGIFKFEVKQHYIVDSETYHLRRFFQEGDVAINIPFGYKLSESDLDLLNLINMDDQEISKFRIRNVLAHVEVNTIYQYVSGLCLKHESNMHVKATIRGSRKSIVRGQKNGEIPIDIQATQHVTSVKTNGVKPMTKGEMTKRVKRENVAVY